MDVFELLSQVQKSGVIIGLSPQGKLRVSPPGKLPDELREAIKRRKEEISAILARPHIINNELRIPFESDPKYHWWRGGQSIAQTLQELNAPPEMFRRYCGMYTETRQ